MDDSMKRIISLLSNIRYKLCTKKALIFFVFLLLFSCMIFQQIQILVLQDRLDQITSGNSDSYPGRLTNLEYIINAHTANLKEADSDLWYLKDTINDLRWRIMQLEWKQPSSEALPPSRP